MPNREVQVALRDDLKNGGINEHLAKQRLLEGWSVFTNVAIRLPAQSQVATLRESHRSPPVRFVDLWIPPAAPSIATMNIARGLAVASDRGLDRETLNFLSNGFLSIEIEDLVAQLTGRPREEPNAEEETEETADQANPEADEEVGASSGPVVVDD